MGEKKRKAAALAAAGLSGGGEDAIVRLRSRFARLGIVPDDIGFYNSPAFLGAERDDPEILKAYAEWVMVRPRSPEYDAHVRATVPKAANIVGRRLGIEQTLRACLNTAAALTLMFDRLGVWSCVVRGSTNITDTARPSMGTRYWWDIDKTDHPNGITGHVWVCAPPYIVVDVTLKHQPWQGEHFGELLPNAILFDHPAPISPVVGDVVCGEVRKLEANHRGRMDPNLHYSLKADLAEMVRVMGAWQGDVGTARLRYVPSAITASAELLEEIDLHSGLRVRSIDIWNNELKPAFGM